MEILFALVLVTTMTNGDYQDSVLGIYDSQKECEQAAIEQKVPGECYPVDRIIHSDELPATAFADF